MSRLQRGVQAVKSSPRESGRPRAAPPPRGAPCAVVPASSPFYWPLWRLPALAHPPWALVGPDACSTDAAGVTPRTAPHRAKCKLTRWSFLGRRPISRAYADARYAGVREGPRLAGHDASESVRLIP